jgi:fatty acid desaturase
MCDVSTTYGAQSLTCATSRAHELTRLGVTSVSARAHCLAVEAEPRATLDIEWLTLAVVAVFWLAFAALLSWHERLPAPAVVGAFALLGGWYMSLQHEIIHGHPTPWWRLNHALVAAPLTLWLPFGLYRDEHLRHHRSDLTDPSSDPESFYVSQRRWDAATAPYRLALRFNRTMLGRVLIGPALGPPVLVARELRRAMRDGERRRMWARHIVPAVLAAWVIFGVADVPAWQYLLGYVYLGMSVTYVRSFVEHLALPPPVTKSAVVRTNWFLGLLFMNNNLHHTHHTLPGAAWYRLPRLTDEIAADDAAAAGAGFYSGYGEVMRRYGLRAFSTPAHPLADRVAQR